jgi:putative two-component system response regulator
MAVADVFDALTSERVYKKAMSFEQARDIIANGRARHFDPDVVDAFLADFDTFVRIAQRGHVQHDELLSVAADLSAPQP